MKQIPHSRIINFFKLFFILLALFATSRMCVFVFNSTYFSLTIAEFLYYLYAGMRFDISAMSYCLSLYAIFFFVPLPYKQTRVFRVCLFLLYIIPISLFLLVNLTDSVYFRFNFKRLTFDVFGFLHSIQSELTLLVIQFIRDFWFVIVIWLGFVFLIAYLYKRLGQTAVISVNMYSYLKNILVFVVVITLLVIGVRGGLQRKPINIASAGLYAPSFYTPLVLNTPFSIIRTIGRETLEEKNFFFNTDAMYRQFSMYKHYHKDSSDFEKKNIVLVVLESFSNEHLNSLQKEKTISNKLYAPFLDSLIQQGIFFPNMFANGKRSSEGIPSIVSSIPSLMNTAFINSLYINNTFKSLPLILKEHNYHSYFFHGGHNGTMNFDSYAMLAGFDKYFGKNEYNNNNDFDGYWGIWDEPYLQYVANLFVTKPEPFFSLVFTLSSHHPYQVPSGYSDILPDGPLPIHKAIAYTDLALKRFFQTASTLPWYQNTIFIITSDHSSVPYLNYYKSSAGMYSIPFLIYEPSMTKGEMNYTTAQQTDILPAILDYMKFNESFIAFGNSPFQESEPHFSISYMNGVYQIITDSLLVRITDDRIIELYDMRDDRLQQNNIVDDTSYIFYKKQIKNLYKSYIQQFNNSMIHNDFHSNYAVKND
jgi:phosphoglycerol transferase MdoB-like AlkP superfamily enzyme